MENITLNITEAPENVTLNIEECLSRVYTDGITITGTGRPTNPLTAVAGTGDMLRSTYDPTNVNANAFDMENMIEGATKKILTSAERTKLNNLSGTNTGDQDLTPYLTSATAAATYQPIGSYLTTISGLNISQLTNDSGYITSSALSPYLTATAAASTYQQILVSGTTIKTINGNSVLGSGNITISGVPVLPAGSIPFSDGTTLIDDTSSIYINPTTKYVGIGTNSPTNKLTLSGGLTFSASGTPLAYTIARNGNYMQINAGPDGFVINNSTNTLNFLSISSTGNLRLLGLGGTARLHLPAGTAAVNTAPVQFTSGTLESTARAGLMEYNNTFHLTNSDATRRHIVLAPNTTKVTAAAPYTNDGYIVVNIGGTDFKLMTTA